MSRHTLQVVLDSLETAVLGCDAEGMPVLFNRAARDLFGSLVDGTPIDQWPRHLRITDASGRCLDADDLSLLRAKDGEHVRDTEVIVTLPGCNPRSFRVHGDPVDDDGPVAAVVALHETTTQRLAERLKDCELQISALLSRPEPSDTVMADSIEVIGDMLHWAAAEFWAVDPVGHVLRRGTCWAAEGHRLPGELPGQLVEGEGLAGRAWQHCSFEWSGDLCADAARKTQDWGTLHGALAVPIPSGIATLGVLVCYSDSHETPDDTRIAVVAGIAAHLGEFLERRRAEQYAAELSQTRDEYITLVGHELRTPLTSIQSCTEMLRAEPDLPIDDRVMLLDVMHRNTDRLHALVAKLLDVAGARSGQIPLNARVMNLAEVARAAADQAVADSPVAVVVNTAPDVIIEGDPDRLLTVVGELLSNAITWAVEHSTVGITLRADEHTAVLAVTNTGPRVPHGERDRVFEPFFRTDRAQTQGIPGTGLGLTYARAVIEQHGGTITISEPDEAVTTFTMRLPVTGHPSKPIPQPASTADH